MSSGQYCDYCNLNRNFCDCGDSTKPPYLKTNFLNGWSRAIRGLSKGELINNDTPQLQKVLKAIDTKPTKEVVRSDAYDLTLEEHSAEATGLIEAFKEEWSGKMDVTLKRIQEENPHRFTSISIGSIKHLGPDLPEMLDYYPRKKIVGESPLKYGWNCVKKFKPPSGKLQFYTISGICIYGEFNSIAPGYVTDWAYLLPSPSKQRGGLK